MAAASAALGVVENEEADRLAHQLDSQRRTGDVLAVPDSDVSLSRTTALSFSDMGLSLQVLEGLQRAGFQRPSPVQIKAIPLGRMGMDLIVQAKSGTGKTVVFSVVVLEAIDVRRQGVEAIVVSPTREIALQSCSVIRQLGHFIKDLRVQLFVGGLPLAEDIKNLATCKVAVGTPGRLKYLIKSGHLDCTNARLLVLDEADLLFSGGGATESTDTELLTGKNTFPAAINFIWWSLPDAKQVLALSATYTQHLVEQHLPRYLRSPVLVRVSSDDPSLLGVRQYFRTVATSKSPSPAAVFMAKVKELQRMLKEIDFRQCLVFSNFHNSAEKLCETLRSGGWPVNYISSGLNQKDRFKAFQSLRAFQCKILVSTDLTARGIDAENVNLVVSLEVPWTRETYLHRVGRAGRFGSYGASILLVSDSQNEMSLLSRIQDPNSASPILQLPNPIPVDLANSECQIDLSKIVSVTKIATQSKRPPSFSTRPADATIDDDASSGDRCVPVDATNLFARKRPVPRKPIGPEASCPSRRQTQKKTVVEGGTSSLAVNIQKYIELSTQQPKIKVDLLTDANNYSPDCAEPSPAFDIEFEDTVIHQIANFLNNQPPVKCPLKVGDEAEEAEELEEEEDDDDEMRNVPTPEFLSQSPANVVKSEPCHCHHRHCQGADVNSHSDEKLPRTLTPRQQLLWNEYCRLVQWKDYFYRVWWNANYEYEEALKEYNSLKAKENPRS